MTPILIPMNTGGGASMADAPLWGQILYLAICLSTIAFLVFLIAEVVISERKAKLETKASKLRGEILCRESPPEHKEALMQELHRLSHNHQSQLQKDFEKAKIGQERYVELERACLDMKRPQYPRMKPWEVGAGEPKFKEPEVNTQSLEELM